MSNSIGGYCIVEYWGHGSPSDAGAQSNAVVTSQSVGSLELRQGPGESHHLQKPQGIGEIVSSFFRRVINHRHSELTQKAEQQREEIRQSLVNQITRLSQSNLQFQQLFQWMRSFIKNYPSLHAAFENCLNDLQESSLPPIQIVDEVSVADPLVERWGQEQMREHYWDALKTRVRLFLEQNPAFYTKLDNQLMEASLSELQQNFWEELTPACRRLEQDSDNLFIETDIDSYLESLDRKRLRIVEVGEDNCEIKLEDRHFLSLRENDGGSLNRYPDQTATHEFVNIVSVHSRKPQFLGVDLPETYRWLRIPKPLYSVRLSSFPLISIINPELLEIWKDSLKPSFRGLE